MANLVQLTDFGMSVKMRLLEKNKTQKWLIEEVKSKTGKFFDSGYLQRLMTGKASSASMTVAIKEILGLEDG